MKKFTLIFFMVFISVVGYSQISITSGEVIGAGDVIMQANDNDPAPSILPGDAGANKSWDFSDLEMDSEDTLTCMLPEDTPFWSSFPQANLAMNISDSGYMYIIKNSDKMSWIGMVIDFEMSTVRDLMEEEVTMHIVPEDVIAEFPIEYGNTMDDSYYMMFEAASTEPGIDSVRFKMTRMESEEIDAWGQLTLPLGTYNVLRSHITTTSYDSIWFKSVIGWTFAFASTDEMEAYNWWSDDPGTGFVIATLNVDQGEVSGATFIKDEVIQNIADNKVSDISFDIYPNPVQKELNVKFSRDFKGTVRILSLTGQLIEEQKVENKMVHFDLQQQNGGIYFYEITGEDGTNYQSGKIIKQ